MLFEETKVVYILLPIIIVLLVFSVPSYLRERRQADPVMVALNRFKRTTISCGIIIFVLLLCLPVVWYKYILSPEKIKSIEDSIELQMNMASDLERMRDVIHWAFFSTVFWFWGVNNVVRQIASKANKTSVQELNAGDAEQGVAPELRGQVS